MLRNFFSQTFIKLFMLHINNDAGNIVLSNLVSDSISFFLGRTFGEGDVTHPVGEQDHQRFGIRAGNQFLAEDFMGQLESRRKGRFPPTGISARACRAN